MTETTTTGAVATLTVFCHWDTDEVPPRCRKPRPVTHHATVQVTIPRLDVHDAPVAIRHRQPGIGEEKPAVTEWRVWDGKLWCRSLRLPTGDSSSLRYAGLQEEAEKAVGSDGLVLSLGSTGNIPIDEHEAQERAQAAFADLVFIDNQWWGVSDEPRWYAQTFGLGGNHGGTTLSFGTRATESLSSYRADEATAAVEHACKVATTRGDTQSLPRIPGLANKVEVLIPDALTSPTHDERVAAAKAHCRELIADLNRDLLRAVDEAEYVSRMDAEQVIDQINQLYMD